MTIKEFFKDDRFAAGTGIEIIEVAEGYSRTRLVVTEQHLNAGGRTQGGVLFTMADLALAVAANSHGRLSFSLNGSITFLTGSGVGDTLYAEARERHCGRTTGFYQVDITNQKGDLVATFEGSVFRMGQELPFERCVQERTSDKAASE